MATFALATVGGLPAKKTEGEGPLPGPAADGHPGGARAGRWCLRFVLVIGAEFPFICGEAVVRNNRHKD